MRVVMICDDIRIDRRILQEADTLIAQGHEVILLATWGEGWPEHEHIGPIKVERLFRPAPSRLQSQAKTLLWHARRVAGHLKLRLGNAIRPLGPSVSSAVLKSAAGIVKGLNAIHRNLIVRPSRAAMRLFHLARRASVRDRSLAKRIAFFDPDCIHVHDLPQLRAGVMAQKQLGVPLIYDAHELYPDIGMLSLRQRLVMSRREHRFIQHPDVSITVNPFLAEEMKRRYSLARLEVITNAVNPPADFDPNQRYDRFRSVLPIPTEARILLFQGWMSDDRGLMKIVEALPAVPQRVHAVFMGYGDERNRLRQRAGELGLTSRVHILDAVEQDELIYWSASADAGIIPYPRQDRNYRFCSPNKLFEFIQAGLPMLVNDSAFLRSVIGGERIGLVRVLDTVDDCAAAITELFSSDERLNEFRGRILKVQGDYRWDRQGARLLDIYRSITPVPDRKAA